MITETWTLGFGKVYEYEQVKLVQISKSAPVFVKEV